MPTLKEYLAEQRDLKKTPYFTNIQPDAWNPLRDDAFTYQEEPFTAESEKLIPQIPVGEPGDEQFSYAGAKPPGPPPPPTAETVTPGGEISEEYRTGPGRMGLSPAARWAIDQKIPEKKEAVPEKPPAKVDPKKLFADIDVFNEDSLGKIKKRTGIDLRDYNYIEEAEKLTKTKEPELFRAYFDGQKAYHMIKFLNPAEKQGWERHQQMIAAKDENKLKLDWEMAKKQHEFNLKRFDHQQKEKAKLPKDITAALTPLFVSTDPVTGKPVGEIDAGVEVEGNRFATDLMNGGMSRPKAVALTYQTFQQRKSHEQDRKIRVNEALSTIGPPGMYTSDYDKRMLSMAIKKAREGGATEKEVDDKLIFFNWTEEERKEMLGPEATKGLYDPKDVSRGTGARPKFAGKDIKTPNDLATIVKNDPSQTEAARLYFNTHFGA